MAPIDVKTRKKHAIVSLMLKIFEENRGQIKNPLAKKFGIKISRAVPEISNIVNFFKIAEFVFIFYSPVLIVVHFMITRQWPELMVVWTRKETRFLKYPYKRTGWKLSTRVRVTSAIILGLAFG